MKKRQICIYILTKVVYFVYLYQGNRDAAQVKRTYSEKLYGISCEYKSRFSLSVFYSKRITCNLQNCLLTAMYEFVLFLVDLLPDNNKLTKKGD